MPITPQGLLGRLFHKGALARWRAAARRASKTDLIALRAQRYQARQLKSVLQDLCQQADDRLALPQIGSDFFARPAGTDWAWRPAAWRLRLDRPGRAPVHDKTKIGREIGIYHDCPRSEIAVRQIRNLRDFDLSPFGLRLEVFHFDGNYLSVVVDLPAESCAGLRKHHVIALTATVETEQPITIFARLNLRHGPNTEQILLTLPQNGAQSTVAFDLAYTQLNEQRAERMWIDLMFDNPAMNRVTLRDLTICRYPRAQL
ncbi:MULTISPECIES: DUF6478 family protein [unclassified Yoonia]|uniref:DUF6478 family protein n=1 Tax=unclassified Yoonia TaxID=2629118 RepID=UPI002AFF00CF|nr:MULTISPECIES: DUF6478 family protein [unclassified Yoonia]